MRVKGQILTCDRCGKQAFLELKGEGERDGGFTRWDIFENPPSDWTNISFEQKRCYGIDFNELCPECSHVYEALQFEIKNLADKFRGV